MTLEKLYDIADENKIDVTYFPLQRLTSVAIPTAIAIDTDKLENVNHEKSCLAHELGHCMTGAFYSVESFETRGRMEHRANKWAVQNLIPFDDFMEALQNGYTEPWELAELFDVSEDFIHTTYNMYSSRLQIGACLCLKKD